ncbi:CDP-alcohol phosphatidyltransferase family protein [Salinisphaera hydrothermalis]|uniref:CDP-alcohol phosphatidyltransferase family protein n=1 Tax=Salinisphaera hydrothermalis TaxID=563188 RepID=UPI00333F4D10
MSEPIDSAREDQGADSSRPLDARLARRLVRPLDGTAARPNHLTTVRLVLGLVSAWCLAHGSLVEANIGAFVFALSNFVDHTDGELARMSGASSRFGHLYDLACDAIIHTLLFAALGYGLIHGPLGAWAPLMGLVAGASVAFIFWLHMVMEDELGKAGAKLPSAGLFEIEDVLYLFPLVTIFDIREAFLVLSFIGAPAFAIWLGWYFRVLRTRSTRG